MCFVSNARKQAWDHFVFSQQWPMSVCIDCRYTVSSFILTCVMYGGISSDVEGPRPNSQKIILKSVLDCLKKEDCTGLVM